MAERKLLLLDSTNSIQTSEDNKWCIVDNSSVSNFIESIVTSTGTEQEQESKYRALVSGIPSPWARVLLTRKAVDMPSQNLRDSVLDGCYRLLKSEWRGLIAAYALYPDSFYFSEPIQLNGKSVADNDGNLSIRYVYGQMLFNETPLWLHKKSKYDKKDNPACIQLLYYKKNKVGGFDPEPIAATSPYTFLFSSVNYNLYSAKNEIAWIGNDGKFYDPVRCESISTNDMQRLYSFIEMLKRNINPGESQDNDADKFYEDWLKYTCSIAENKSVFKINAQDDIHKHISAWLTELGRWQAEIKNKIEAAGKEADANIPLTFSSKPQGPLALLLESDYTFYFSDGKLSISNTDGSKLQSSKIFIDSDFIAAWDNSAEKSHANSAAYYVISSDGKYALPLPFTKETLDVLEKNIESIVNGGSNSFVRLYARVGSENRVEFELKANIDGSGSEIPICKKAYQINTIAETEGKVFVWPNFCSKHWNKYYYYSEFPTNVSGVKLLPCFDNIDFSTASDEQASDKYLVRYPINRVAASNHKYEIIENEAPLKSIYIKLNKSGKEIDAGIIVVKRSQEVKDNTMREIATLANLQEASVGIDFGSTNTCAYYQISGRNECVNLPFSNKRLALVGFDSKSKALAGMDDLLFVSNEGTVSENGQIKSWLHLHDPQYITKDGDISSVPDLARVIMGGIPVNEGNITVKAMDEYTITTNAGTLYHNMKWNSKEESESRKIAFMRMLWIHICADMIDKNCYPKNLNWSFPSSMTTNDRKALKRVYSNSVEYPFVAKDNKPVITDYTEAEAVCAYAIRKGTEVNSSKLSLGIDVGGSTSDILIVGINSNAENELMTQSSIRLAGGFFFKAINSSKKFRQALYNFHESPAAKNAKINTINIDDIVSSDPAIYSRAPYYLNNIFDQINSDKDFDSFYGYMSRQVSAVFAYPAYVTGVLMFYSGMLTRNVITKNKLESVKQIEMRYYGKGGRLFEWLLDVYTEDSERYYRKCFNAGYGSEDLSLKIITQNKTENKSEVAIGLVANLFNNIAKGDSLDGQRVISNYDVVGEKGIKCSLSKREIDALETIPYDMFDGGVKIEMPDKLENFITFIDIFAQFIKESNIIAEVKNLKSKSREDLGIRAFIQNDPEFIKYTEDLRNDDSSRPIYKMPIFIAAALCYLNDVLVPEVSKQLQ